MVSKKATFVRAAKFITDITWKTNWSMYLAIFDLENFGNDTPRLYRSQSWNDPDYPNCVQYLLILILEYNEQIALDFLRYVITKEFDLKNEEIVKQDPQLLQALGLIKKDELIPVSYPTIDIFPEKYLDIQILPDDFYLELQEQLNRAYAYNVLPAVQILSRKILENLIIDILRKKYGPHNIDLYYNAQRGRFLGFDKLLKNLSDKINLDDFKGISDNFDNDFIKKINGFREQGNSSAHSIELFLKRDDIKQKKDELNFIIKVLVRVYNSIK